MDQPSEPDQEVNDPKPQKKVWDLISGRGSVGRYGVIGVTGVAFDLAIFSVLVQAGMYPIIATTVGTLAGIINNYTWNSLLNFRLGLSGNRGAKFLTVGVVGLASSAGLLHFLLTTGLDSISAKWISIPIVAGCQFVANKSWTFKTF